MGISVLNTFANDHGFRIDVCKRERHSFQNASTGWRWKLTITLCGHCAVAPKKKWMVPNKYSPNPFGSNIMFAIAVKASIAGLRLGVQPEHT